MDEGKLYSIIIIIIIIINTLTQMEEGKLSSCSQLVSRSEKRMRIWIL